MCACSQTRKLCATVATYPTGVPMSGVGSGTASCHPPWATDHERNFLRDGARSCRALADASWFAPLVAACVEAGSKRVTPLLHRHAVSAPALILLRATPPARQRIDRQLRALRSRRNT
jgi:hypothetical protein